MNPKKKFKQSRKLFEQLSKLNSENLTPVERSMMESSLRKDPMANFENTLDRIKKELAHTEIDV